MFFSRAFFIAASLVSLGFGVQDPPNRSLGSILAGNKQLKQFSKLIKQYPEVLLQLPSLDGVTIVAPSNDAFKNIPYTALKDVWDPDDKPKTVPLLQYHILQGIVSFDALEAGPSYVESTLLTDSRYTNVTSGQNVIINKSNDDTVVLTTSMGTRCTVTRSDIPFRGGLVHIVDSLLIPPAQLDETSEAFRVPSFLGSLYAANLMPDLASHKNITVFAPLDKAYENVGGVLEKMTAEELSRVMGYHVIPNDVLVSSRLTNSTRLVTMAKDAAGNAQSVSIRAAGNNRYVNSAQIVQPDILLANGIMHVVSNVLNPDASAAQPNIAKGPQAPVYPVSSVEDPFTSDIPCSTNCPTTSSEAAASQTSTYVYSSSSTGGASGPRCTEQIADVAIGVMGIGVGMAWL